MSTNKIVQLAIPPGIYAQIEVAAKPKLLTVPAFIRLAVGVALLSDSKEKVLSVREQKSVAHNEAKLAELAEEARIDAKWDAGIRRDIAAGTTKAQKFHGSRPGLGGHTAKSLAKRMAQWDTIARELGQGHLAGEIPLKDRSLAGKSEAEQDAILAAKLAEHNALYGDTDTNTDDWEDEDERIEIE